MSTAYPVTHVTVKDNPPPRRQVISVGRLYDCSPRPEEKEVVFATAKRVEVNEAEEDDERWEDDGGAEEKVVRPRRGRRVKTTEVAETK